MVALDPAGAHRRFVDEVVVGKQVNLLDELFAPDAVVEQGSLEGLREQMQAQADGLDISVTYLHELVSADWVVHHMDISILHVGHFMGVAGTGRSAQLAEVEAARVVDGRIIEMWSVADVVGAMHQLGIPLPTPP
jgi:predicted ester cyclase